MVSIESLESREDGIAVVGLGYVGLPLAVHLSTYFEVKGFDLNSERISELKSGHDRTLEASEEDLRSDILVMTAGLVLEPKILSPADILRSSLS